MKTILVAISKNEGQYIKEWVFYHKLICGFDNIHIYDNDSTDNSIEELNCLSNLGLCSWEDWPRGPGRNPPQQKAYLNAMRKFKNKFDWICFIDIDEFIVLHDHKNIKDFVSSFDEKTGSISFNWLVFYSLDKKATKDSIIKRVNYCKENANVKTIARAKAVSGFNFGIHTFPLISGYKYMHCSGLEYILDDKVKTSLDVKLGIRKEYFIYDLTKAQVNHYQMKSEQEVLEKDKKGRATISNYTPKNTINKYKKFKQIKKHETNDSIKKYIENTFGLENFYNKIKNDTIS